MSEGHIHIRVSRGPDAGQPPATPSEPPVAQQPPAATEPAGEAEPPGGTEPAGAGTEPSAATQPAVAPEPAAVAAEPAAPPEPEPAEPPEPEPARSTELVPVIYGRELAPADALRRTTRVAFGVLEFGVTLFARALDRAVPPDLDLLHRSRSTGPANVLPNAAVGLGLAAERRALEVVEAAQRNLEPAVRATTQLGFVRAPLEALRRTLDGWSAAGAAEQPRNRLAAEAFSRAFITEVAVAVIDNLDINDIIDRIDLNEIIARVDINQIIARVDIDAIVGRVEIAHLIEDVARELDIGSVLRESTSTMGAETVDALRVQSMRADHLVAAIVDRILVRRAGRDTALGRSASSGGAAPDGGQPPEPEPGP